MATRFLRRLSARSSDEGGYVLVLAMGIMIVLSLTITSVLSYTSSGTRTARVSDAGQRANALAEAGINNALSVLAKTGTDPTAMGAQPASAGDPYSTTTTYTGGTATWGASYTAATRTWTIKSIGAVSNPTGPTPPDLTRTLFASAVIPVPPYSFVALNSSCDSHTLVIRSSGVLTVTNAIYTNSCNAGHDAFDVFGTGGSISSPDIRVVGGWETHNGDDVIVGGVTCPLLNANPPLADQAGCPKMGQPVLADPFASTPAPTLGATPACPTATYGAAASYSPKQTIGGSVTMTATQTTLTSSGTAIANGDIIVINTEDMLVLNGGGTTNLTVQRGYMGTTAATHTKATEIKKIPVTGSQGTAANPDMCKVPANAGTVTLAPGTYYGGICIGGPDSSTDCTGTTCSVTAAWSTVATTSKVPAGGITNSATSTVVSGSTTIVNGDVIQIDSELLLVTGVSIGGSGKSITSTLTFTRGYSGSTAAAHAANAVLSEATYNAPTTNVTLSPGTYIMAGGGFWVCGNATLSAPNVMIYNTNDPTNTAGNGAIDTILLNTSGSVSLGPQTTGAYAGLTIFQDRALAVSSAKCDPRGTDTNYDNDDISFQSMASTGANGALGSVSGTIYAANNTAIFSDGVSGTANLAIMTGCIGIDGATSTFDFNPGGLFGSGVSLQKQWG